MGALYNYNGLIVPYIKCSNAGTTREATVVWRAEGTYRFANSGYMANTTIYCREPETGLIYAQYGSQEVYELQNGVWVRRSDLDFGIDDPKFPGEDIVWSNVNIQTRKLTALTDWGTDWREKDADGVLVSDDNFVLEALPEVCPAVEVFGETGIFPGARIRNITTGEVVDISGEAAYALEDAQAGFAWLDEDRQLVILEEGSGCGSVTVYVRWAQLPEQVAVLTVPVGDPAVRKGRFWVGFAAGAAMCGAPVGMNREAAGDGGSGGWPEDAWKGFACGVAIGALMTERL